MFSIFAYILPVLIIILTGIVDYYKRRTKLSSESTSLRERHLVASTDMTASALPDAWFINLPDEILITIAQHLDLDSLSQLRATCHHLKEISDPFIYENFDVLHGDDAIRLANCIHGDQRRAKWIKSLLVSTKYGEDSGLAILPECLAGMRNMRHLRLETPDCNTKPPEAREDWINLQKGYESILARSTIAIDEKSRLLPNLQTCTIHFVDDTKALYPLTRYSSIFLHPTLKSLTLSCACTDYPSRLLVPYQKRYKHSTALEHLHLEECDVLSSSLHVLLSFPRALKSLVLSEGTRYDAGFGPVRSRLHGDVLPGIISTAITRSCGQSLQRLSLDLGYRRGDRNINGEGRYLDLTQLENVRILEISADTTQNTIIPRPHCDHGTFKRLPPNLEVLRIFGINPYHFPPTRRIANIPFQTCLIKDKSNHGVPKLQHVIWSYEHQGFESRNRPDVIARRIVLEETQRGKQISQTKEYLTDLCNKAYPIYVNTSTRMTIEFVETPPHYIPPYLYPEPKPTSHSIWDSNDPPVQALHALQIAQQKVQESRDSSNTTNSHQHTNTSIIGIAEENIAADADGADFDLDSDSDFEDFIALAPQAQAFMAMLMQNVVQNPD